MNRINLIEDSLKEKLVQAFFNLSELEKPNNIYKSRAYNLSRSKISDGKLYSLDNKNRVIIYSDSDSYKLGETSSKVFIEILNTGTTKKLIKEHNQSDLKNISGLGPIKVNTLIKSNVKTVNDLLNLKLKIGDKILNSGIRYTEQIDTGLKLYLSTMNKRIPRDLATNYLNEFKSNLINNGIKNFQMYVVGSYRRLRTTVGDLDIIITNEPEKGIIGDVRLIISEWLDDIFVNGDKKISGVKYNTQVDVRFINRKYLGAHLLHGTGSREFNICMRRIAKSQGVKLNEYGIEKDGKLITFEKEKDIFDYLNVNYVHPKDR